MKKRIVAIVMAMLMLISCVIAAQGSVRAVPTSSRVVIDGKTVAFTAYNIGGANYFKLRDLAMALRESTKPFGIQWDAASGYINILPGENYAPIGGELSVNQNTNAVSAVASTHHVRLDGNPVFFDAYNIDGANYFKLRDVMEVLQIEVAWDAQANTIRLSTEKDDAAVLAYGNELVSLVSSDFNNYYVGSGIGIVVSKSGDILTTFDVVSRASKVSGVYRKDGKTYQITGIRAYDREKNLALLTSQITTQTPAQIADQKEVPSDAAFRALVRDESDEIKLLSGTVATLGIKQKNWGAPVFNRSGMIVGCAYSRSDGETETTQIAWAKDIQSWLNKVGGMTISQMFAECYPLAGKKTIKGLENTLAGECGYFQLNQRDEYVEQIYILQNESNPKTLQYICIVSGVRGSIQQAIRNNDDETLQDVRRYCRDMMERASAYFPDYEHEAFLTDMGDPNVWRTYCTDLTMLMQYLKEVHYFSFGKTDLRGIYTN